MVDHTTRGPAALHGERAVVPGGHAILLIGRILLGWIFFVSGWGKVTGIAGFAGYLGSLGVPGGELAAWVTAVAELLIGAALILGIGTRLAAIAAVVFVAVATALAHRYWEFPAEQQSSQFNSFVKNLAIIGGALYVYVAGAGRYSLDRMLTSGR